MQFFFRIDYHLNTWLELFQVLPSLIWFPFNFCFKFQVNEQFSKMILCQFPFSAVVYVLIIYNYLLHCCWLHTVFHVLQNIFPIVDIYCLMDSNKWWCNCIQEKKKTNYYLAVAAIFLCSLYDRKIVKKIVHFLFIFPLSTIHI